MSRLLPDRYVVDVERGVVRLRRRAFFGRQFVPLDEKVWHTDDQAEYLDAVATLIADQKGLRRIDIVLHDDLALYASLPWPGVSLSRDEVARLAAIRIEEVYGSSCLGWQHRYCQEFGARGLVSAASAPTRDRLTAFQRQHRCRVGSIKPALADLVDSARIPLRSATWIAVDLTTHGLLLALHDVGGWESVRYVRRTGGSSVDPVDILRRECALLGLPGEIPLFLQCGNRWNRTSVEAAVSVLEAADA